METTESVMQTQDPGATPDTNVVETPGAATGGEAVDSTGKSTSNEDPSKGRQEGTTDGELDLTPAQQKVNRRFRELTDELRNERARAQAKDELLAEMIRGGVRRQVDPRLQPGDQDPEPDRRDPRFAEMDYEEFLYHHTRWAARQEFNSQLQNYERRQQVSTQQRMVMQELHRISGDHVKRVETYTKADPSFKEVLDSDAPIHPMASVLVQMNEDSPRVLHELHRSPQLLERLNACRTPFQMAELIGRIAAGAKSRAPQVPNAPAPGQTTGGRSSSDPDKPPEDTAEYIKWANKRFGTR